MSSDRKRNFVGVLVRDLGIDVNYSPYPGLTALYIACKYHNSSVVVEELLRLGARVNDMADDKRPIDALLEHGITEVINVAIIYNRKFYGISFEFLNGLSDHSRSVNSENTTCKASHDTKYPLLQINFKFSQKDFP